MNNKRNRIARDDTKQLNSLWEKMIGGNRDAYSGVST
jgi:hypothetical protein